MGESKFTGGLLGYILHTLVGLAITFITLGIAFPWAICFVKKWEVSNTYIDGRALYFDGSGTQLFGNYIKWFLLTIITFGIYSFWLNIAMKKWITKHTHFLN